MLANKAVGNIAIPFAAACWLVGHRTLWASDESHEYVTMATPHLHGGSSQPADMLREPLLFQDAFPWFPAGFPWTSPQRRFSLVMQGGAAAHMLHKRGFGDMDFYICSQGGDFHSHNDDANQLVEYAALSLCDAAARTLLVHRHDRLTCMLDMPDGSKRRVQFLLRILRSISEILLSADLDVTQVVYHGAADARHGLYLSPLALEAFSGGVITIRSMPKRTTCQRARRYVSRGFGVRAATLLSLPAEMFREAERFMEDEMFIRAASLLSLPDEMFMEAELLMEDEMFTDDSSGPDGMWQLFIHDLINDSFLQQIGNKMMCHGKRRICPTCIPLQGWFGEHCWTKQALYDIRDHLAHLKVRNARSTRQFLRKADKCSLPDPSLLSALLETT